MTESPLPSGADAKGASVATAETLVSQRSPAEQALEGGRGFYFIYYAYYLFSPLGSSSVLIPQVAPIAAALVGCRGLHLATYGDTVGRHSQHALCGELLDSDFGLYIVLFHICF